jgi:hypothetical protein
VTEHERGTDRLGRRAKRFLTPLQKYEIWLQLQLAVLVDPGVGAFDHSPAAYLDRCWLLAPVHRTCAGDLAAAGRLGARSATSGAVRGRDRRLDEDVRALVTLVVARPA